MSTDRGDNGAVPDPMWSGTMLKLDHVQRDDYFAQHAQCGTLKANQVRALLQGLPPPAAGWEGYGCVLSDYDSTIRQWDADVAAGTAKRNPTPAELRDWCAKNGAELPESLTSKLASPSPLSPPAKQNPVTVSYPPWAPLAQPMAPQSQPQRRPGRPKIAQAMTDNLIDAATRLLMDRARKGQVLSIPGIVKELRKTPEYETLEAATLQRRLNGKLPWARARKTAAQAPRKKASDRGMS